MKNLLFSFLLLSVLSISCEEGPEGPEKLADPYESGIVSTVNNGKEGDEDGPISSALFNAPIGVAIGSDGSLYVADSKNFKIKKIDPEGNVSTLAGSTKGHSDGQGSEARFQGPGALAIGNDDILYVGDGNRIRKVLPTGLVSTIAGEETEGFLDGPAMEAQFSNTLGLSISDDGTLFIADVFNHRIRKLSTDGMVSTIAGEEEGYEDSFGTQAKFSAPFSVAVADDGNLYVTDTYNHRIRKISPAGEVTTLAGDGKVSGDGHGADFVAPMDLKVGHDGNIYVADTYHYRIRRVTPEGEMSTITGDRMDYADGSFQEAAFIDIFAIAIAKDGSMVVTEANADRIRSIKPD